MVDWLCKIKLSVPLLADLSTLCFVFFLFISPSFSFFFFLSFFLAFMLKPTGTTICLISVALVKECQFVARRVTGAAQGGQDGFRPEKIVRG